MTDQARRRPAIPEELTKVVRDIHREGCPCGSLRRRAPMGVTVSHVRNHLHQIAQEGK